MENKRQIKKTLFSYEQVDESPGFLLWQVSMIWQRQINALLKQFDLTHAQFVLLATLCWFKEHNREATQIKLAHFAQMDPMMASTVLRTLEKKELLVRAPDKKDPRANLVTITSKGLTKAAIAIEAVESFDRKFFGILGPQETKFNTFLNALLKE
jgi:MarR family transcriptional regulator, organic hydroperoxide resistance regulator